MNPLGAFLQSVMQRFRNGPQRGPAPFPDDQEGMLRYGQPLDSAQMEPVKRPDQVESEHDRVRKMFEARTKELNAQEKRAEALRKKADTARTEFEETLDRFNTLKRPEAVPAKRMTDSQALLPILFGALAKLGGARDEFVQPAVSGYHGSVFQNNAKEAEEANARAFQDFASEQDAIKFLAGHRARTLEQDELNYRNEADNYASGRDRLGKDMADYERTDATLGTRERLAKDANSVRERLAGQKGWAAFHQAMSGVYGDGWEQRDDANEILVKNAPLAFVLTGKDPNKPAETEAKTKESMARTLKIPEEINLTKAKVRLTESQIKKVEAEAERVSFLPEEARQKLNLERAKFFAAEDARDAKASDSARKELLSLLMKEEKQLRDSLRYLPPAMVVGARLQLDRLAESIAELRPRLGKASAP